MNPSRSRCPVRHSGYNALIREIFGRVPGPEAEASVPVILGKAESDEIPITAPEKNSPLADQINANRASSARLKALREDLGQIQSSPVKPLVVQAVPLEVNSAPSGRNHSVSPMAIRAARRFNDGT